MIRLSITTTLPSADEVMRRLRSEARVHLDRVAQDVEAEIKAAWTGWKYEGRPKGAPQGTSQAAWQVRVDDDLRLGITNEARDWRYGRPYAKYVHRAGRPKTERVADELLDNMRSDLVRRVQQALLDGLEVAVRPDSRREVR